MLRVCVCDVCAVQINILGTENVIKACNELGVRCLFASTCCAYGNNNTHPSTEDAPLCPGEPYAISKKIGEAIVAPTEQNRHTSWLIIFFKIKKKKKKKKRTEIINRWRGVEAKERLSLSLCMLCIDVICVSVPVVILYSPLTNLKETKHHQ